MSTCAVQTRGLSRSPRPACRLVAAVVVGLLLPLVGPPGVRADARLEVAEGIPRPPDPPADPWPTPGSIGAEALTARALDEVTDRPEDEAPDPGVQETRTEAAPPTYPVVVNATVEALIDSFVAKHRDRFGLWIARSGRYLPMIQQVFRERGLPEELAYTAMIESGYSPLAVSRVGAKGLWQFMEATGRRYGLAINRWVDERLDPLKATVAAAQYLGDLYGMFGHWFLAQAGYNAGEHRVASAIARARTSDFWLLSQTRYLPEETKLFVPQILAAMLIAREPARYGFDVTPEPPLAYDEVELRRPLDLDTVAGLAGVSVARIRELNPALLARLTPPFANYRLRLPSGTGAGFEAALRGAPPGSLPSWTVHRVGSRQSLAEIARLYRVSPRRLAELNHLSGGRLRGVAELIVPAVDGVTGAPMLASAPAEGPRLLGASRGVVVRPGDTLSGLAARHRVALSSLIRVNGLDPRQPLRPGTRLRLP